MHVMAGRVGCVVAVLLCFTGRARSGNGEIKSEFGGDHPTLLVENIRRQLMNENYDYMPSESEQMFPIKHELSNEDTTANTPPPDSGSVANRAVELDSDINEQFFLRANDVEHDDNFSEDNGHVISEKDLLYYVDDDRLKHEVPEKAVTTTATVVAPTSPSAKYKVLRVKEAHANRRSQTFRRFIQEEGEDGVAIINLNDEPFPEFQLPSSRRQYMMDQDDFHSEMEIAALSEMEEEVNLNNDTKIDVKYTRR